MKVIRTVSAFGVIAFALGIISASSALAGPVLLSDLQTDEHTVALIPGTAADAFVPAPADDNVSDLVSASVDPEPTLDSSSAAAIVESTFTAGNADPLASDPGGGTSTPAADAVPEPATLVLLGSGLIGLAAALRPRRA